LGEIRCGGVEVPRGGTGLWRHRSVVPELEDPKVRKRAKGEEVSHELPRDWEQVTTPSLKHAKTT